MKITFPLSSSAILTGAALMLIASSCSGSGVEVTVNPSTPRSGDIVEIPAGNIVDQLGTDRLLVVAQSGDTVMSQLTHDNKLIFPGADGTYKIVPASATTDTSTTVSDGKPVPAKDALVFGRLYPERADDIAWENDLVGFRIYGPATQAKGEKAFGYDIFFKYPGTGLVVEDLYRPETDPATWVKVDSLRAIDPALAEEFIKSFSYHIDHGKGMDCYAVGPTLGAGVAALMPADSIAFPWCYDKAEVLDNGPLRFTVELTFAPKAIGADSAVVEHRLISLDAGSHMNRTRVWYDGLTVPTPVTAGLPRRDDTASVTDSDAGIIAYADPTQGPDNGRALLGVYFPAGIREACERDGHILGVTDYTPGDTLEYYWGFAWDKTDIKNMEEWRQYLESFSRSHK